MWEVHGRKLDNTYGPVLLASHQNQLNQNFCRGNKKTERMNGKGQSVKKKNWKRTKLKQNKIKLKSPLEKNENVTSVNLEQMWIQSIKINT